MWVTVSLWVYLPCFVRSNRLFHQLSTVRRHRWSAPQRCRWRKLKMRARLSHKCLPNIAKISTNICFHHETSPLLPIWIPVIEKINFYSEVFYIVFCKGNGAVFSLENLLIFQPLYSVLSLHFLSCNPRMWRFSRKTWIPHLLSRACSLWHLKTFYKK